MRQALQDEPLTVYGDGSQTRSFTYVKDTVEGIFRLLLSDIVDPVNIGNPNEITILDFAKEIIALTNSPSPVIFETLPEDDPLIRQPDVTRARQWLQWQPQFSRAEGLRLTLANVQDQLNALANR